MKTDKNIAKGNKDITLPGIALLGTINSLTNIGISPERILSKWGIKKNTRKSGVLVGYKSCFT